MALREVLLLGSLVAIGSVSFIEERERSRRRLGHLLRRKRGLERDIRTLCRQQRLLKYEARALRTSRYYIERMAREELGWLPIEELAPTPWPEGRRGATPSELVRADGKARQPLDNPAGPRRSNPSPSAPPSRQPLPGAPADRGREMLAALGYGSIAHFQGKMMRRRASGVLDAATIARASQLVAMLRRTRCGSVKAFQARHRLSPDGVFGRRTERRMREVLSARAGRRGRTVRNGIVVHRGAPEPRRSGG